MATTTLNTITQYLAKRIFYVCLIVFIIAAVACLIVIVNNPQYSYLIYIIPIFFILLELWFLAVALKQKPAGSLVIRRKKRSLRYMLLITPILYTINYFVARRYSHTLALVICLYALAIIELIMYFLYKRFKPIAFILEGERITVVSATVDIFDVSTLVKVGLNNMENEIVFRFKNKQSFHAPITEFSRADVLQLLAFCVNRSQVIVQPLVYAKLQPPAPPLPFFKRVTNTIKDTLLP